MVSRYQASTTEDVDIKVHTARTVVDKWKMKVKKAYFGRKPIVF
jgi:hypothetical protein